MGGLPKKEYKVPLKARTIMTNTGATDPTFTFVPFQRDGRRSDPIGLRKAVRLASLHHAYPNWLMGAKVFC